jgi:hypothetical protein
MDGLITESDAKYPIEGIGRLQRVTLKQRLERDRVHHKERLEAIEKALAMMEENPKLVEMLEAIQKAQ